MVEETVQSINIMLAQSLVPLMTSGQSGSSNGAAGWSSRPLPLRRSNLTSDAVAGPPPRDIGATAIIYEGWKLIVTTRKDSDDPPQFELFRQSDDPLDQENLADQHPEVVGKLKGMVEEWREVTLAGQLPEKDSTTEMIQEELQRLKSLGYSQ